VPGITRSVQEKIKVCDEPVTYMYDTPGVVSPYVPTPEVGMKLALIGKLICIAARSVAHIII